MTLRKQWRAGFKKVSSLRPIKTLWSQRHDPVGANGQFCAHTAVFKGRHFVPLCRLQNGAIPSLAPVHCVGHRAFSIATLCQSSYARCRVRYTHSITRSSLLH